MPHKVTLPTLDLQIGMFVSDIDRPWIDTPFLMQGLLIEDETQIASLQNLCATVTIDRSRSLGNAYSERSNSTDLPRAAGQLPAFRQVSDAQPDDFASICRRLHTETQTRRYRCLPELNADQQSQLEAELLYSAPLVDDIKVTLRNIHDALAQSRNASLKEIGGQVSELAKAVERNPDAMLWLASLRSADQYSYDHALDVSVHLMVFARFLGLPAKDVERAGLAGMMQDIGKIDIPPEILAKESDLTDDEYEQVKSHVASSIEILLGQEGFSNSLLEIVASHHERSDGSGYPRRLKGERIGFLGELAGLVDSYCAMTRLRPYGPAISSQKALEALIHMRGSKFRESVVDQFVQCIGLYPIGSLVELNTGEVGVVIQQNQVRRLKPRLLIMLAADKSVERYPITLDLMMEPVAGDGTPYRILHAVASDAYGIDPSEFYLG